VQPRVSLESLMTVDEIAAALKLNVDHVRDRLVHEAGFPRPVVNRPRFRRWRRDAIERWLGEQEALNAR
jgi:predicted DNA-binding transcriptional regulator AlpA